MNVLETIKEAEGSERDLTFALTKGGAAYDLTDLKVTCYIFDRGSGTSSSINTTDDSDEINISDAEGGEVTLTPGSDFWTRGSYFLHFKVLEDGKNYRFPATQVFKIDVTDDERGG